MTCKNCNKELPEFCKFCLYCGASQEDAAEETVDETVSVPETITEEVIGEEMTDEAAEEACEELTEEIPEEAPTKSKLKTWQRIVLIGCCVVLAVAAVFLALTIAGVDLKPKENDIYRKESYTATAETLVDKSQTVVATLGDKQLTLGELQMHYQSAFYTFYSQNMYYISYLGLDVSQPLDQQSIPTTTGDSEPLTWQQYFIEAALDNWESYVRLEIEAEKAGFEIAPELKEVLDNIETNAQEMATAYGYETIDEWLYNDVAPGATLNDYGRYNRAYYTGSDFLNYYYESNYPDEAQIRAYYGENQAVFEENGITQDLGLNATVRHILIQPQGGTTDESGATTYSEEEWDAAHVEAKRILEEWKAGAATEESFAELANTYSADGGSNTTGGLYADINIDANFVDNFKNWASDATRVTGDTGIVESPYGYHIMYFVSGEEYWLLLAGEQILADQVQAMMKSNMDTYPIEVEYKNILVGELMVG